MSDQAVAMLTRADFKSTGRLADANLKDLKDILRAHLSITKLRNTGKMSRAQAVTRVVSGSIPACWDQILAANTFGPMDKVDQVIHNIIFGVKKSTKPEALQTKEKPHKKIQFGDDSSSLSEPDSDSDSNGPKSPVAGTSEDQAQDVTKLEVPAEVPIGLLPGTGEEAPKAREPPALELAPIEVTDHSVITVFITDERVGAHPHNHKTIIIRQQAGLYLIVDVNGTVHIRTKSIVEQWMSSQWFARLGENQNDVFYIYGDTYIPGTLPDSGSKLQPIAFTYVDAGGSEPAYLMKFYNDPPLTNLIADWDSLTSTWRVELLICIESDLPPHQLPLLMAQRDQALSQSEEKRRMNANKRGRSTSSASPPPPPHIRDNPPKPKKSRKKMTPEEQSESKANVKQKLQDQFDACVAHLQKMFGSDLVVVLLSDLHSRKTKHMVATVKQWASKILEIMETCTVTPDGFEIKAVHVQKFTGRSPDWVKQALDVAKLLQNARICALPGVRTWLDTKYGDVGMKSYLAEFKKVVKEAEEVAAEEPEEGGEGLKA